MDFPKKQQQCLIPRYLLQYLQDLQISHNDPTAPWGGGGGGGSYTAGDGIDITNDVISVDDTVALKTDLADYVTSSELITELGNYVTSTDLAAELLNYAELSDIPTKTSDLTNDSGFITSSALTGYATESWVTNQGYSTFSGSYNDLTNKPTIPDAVSGTNDGTNWTSLTIGNTTYNIPSGGGSSYSAGTWINIDSNNNINVSNPYISLLDDSGNPRVMISSTSNGTAPTFTATYCNITPTGFGIVDKTQGTFGGYNAAYTYYRHRDILVNGKWSLSFPTDFGTIATQEWTRDWVTNKGYVTSSSLADVATSGSYNDLIYKPTIPTISGAVSGNYWTSININGTSKNIPSSSDFVTIGTSQNIKSPKTFVGNQLLRFKQNAGNDTIGFTAYDYNGNEVGNLQVANRTVGRNTYKYVTLGNYSNYSAKSKVGFRVQPNSSTNSYNFVMPYGSNTEFTSNTYSTSSDTTIPCAFTDGTTIVKADATGLVNISSISGGGGGGTTVSGTNDGTNWTSITIGSDTYGIPSGGGSSSPVYAMVDIDGEKVNGEAQDLDNDYTSFYFSLIVDISNMTINDAKELYNNNNANYDFAASAATYSSNFNYGRISFSDDTGEHHINSITYDSVNEIVTIYYDNSTKTYTFTENELTNSSLQIDNIIQGSNEPAVYNFTLADWTADTSTNGYISNTAMVREGLDLSTLSAGQTVKIDCIFVRPSNGTSYVHQFTLVIPDGTMATESTDTFQIPGTNQTNLQIEAWMQISNNRIGLFWNNSKTRYISKVKVYPANA